MSRRFWLHQIAGLSAYAAAMDLSRLSFFPPSYMVEAKGALALLGLEEAAPFPRRADTPASGSGVGPATG